MIKAIYALAFVAGCAVLAGRVTLRASETDERIEASFNKSYACRTFFTNDAIKVVSVNGVVTLSGQVNEPSHWDLAQETVTQLPGVQKIDNRLKVVFEGTDKSDAWIRAKVRSVLALHRQVSGSHTEVDVKDGVITLRGTATSEAQRDLASEYAQDVNGVLRVTNVMVVAREAAVAAKTEAPAPVVIDDASITALVKVALRSHHSTSAVTTKVATAEGVVTVTGTARNEAEKALVTKLAADIVGVKSVVNNMTL